jgi:hypothetical protein
MGSAEVLAQFTLEELLGVVQAGADGAFGAPHDAGDFTVTEPVDFE